MCERCNQNEAVLTTPIRGVPIGLCLNCANVAVRVAKGRESDLKKQAKATKKLVKAARHCKCGVVLPSIADDFSRCSACQKEDRAAARSITPIYTKI